jgi:hypothetical protein
MKFTAESFYNAHLPVGAKRLDAVITVTAVADSGMPAIKRKRLVIFIGDVSGSMEEDNKLQQMKHAVRVGIDSLDSETMFAVVKFSSSAAVVVEPTLADGHSKAVAHKLVQDVRAGGGTLMSNALIEAKKIAARAGADIVQVYFVTDGGNEKDDRRALDSAIGQCSGLLQANCWGIGTDWKPDDLRKIAGGLIGSADAVPDAASLQQKMKESLEEGMSKAVSGVVLRLWMPRTVQLSTLKQMSPEILDLLPLSTRVDDKTIDIPLGAWGSEARDYHLGFELTTQAEGDEMMVCRPKVVVKTHGEEAGVDGQRIVAAWSSDESLTTRINGTVAHYTGQEELARSIRDGMEAKARGDIDQATVLLGRATKIAAETGNEEVTRRLKKVVDVIDVAEGTVRLRAGASKGDDMELDLGGTRTVRRRPATTTSAA